MVGQNNDFLCNRPVRLFTWTGKIDIVDIFNVDTFLVDILECRHFHTVDFFIVDFIKLRPKIKVHTPWRKNATQTDKNKVETKIEKRDRQTQM